MGAMLGFGLWSSSTAKRTAVLAASREISAGSTISVSDLRRVDVSTGGGVATVPAGESDRVVGKVARITIPAGGLLSAAQVSDTSPLGAGEAVVGVVLSPGELPTTDLRVGDRVEVMSVDNTNGSGSTSASGVSGAVTVASVFGVEQSSADGSGQSTDVSLLVSQRSAGQVAAAAGAGRVRLLLLPPTGPVDIGPAGSSSSSGGSGS